MIGKRARTAASMIMATISPLVLASPIASAGSSSSAKTSSETANHSSMAQSEAPGASIRGTSAPITAGYQSAAIDLTGVNTNFSQGQTSVTLANDINGSFNLTPKTTVNSSTSLTIQLPSGADGIGAGSYTLTVTTGDVTASTPITIAPYTNADTVQWDGIYSDQSALYLSDPNPSAGTKITISVRAYSGNLTGAVLNYYDTATNQGAQVNMQPGKTFGPYQLWSVTIPASDGGTIWYRFDLKDGNSFACLSGDGLHTADTNQNNFPVPVGNFSLSASQANPGDQITASDNWGDFSGGTTTVQFLNDSGAVVATANGQNAGWGSVDFAVPDSLSNGMYTVAVVTDAKDANGVINSELKRTAKLWIGPMPAWLNDFKHDSYQAFYRSPFGAVPSGTPVTLRLRGPLDATSATLRLWTKTGSNKEMDLPMTKLQMSAEEIAKLSGEADASAYSWWTVTIPASDVTTPGAMWYQFEVTAHDQTVYYDDNDAQLEGVGQPSFSAGGPSYQLNIYHPSYQTPDWLKHAVIYEIMPDRFFDGDPSNDENPKTQQGVGTTKSGQEGLVPIQFHKNWSEQPFDPDVTANPGDPNYQEELKLRGDGDWSTDFFGGDLQGIQDKLDYLQSLGVNTLYLMPIFESESNHKYDTGNFMKIDPGFGTMQDYLNLVKAAKAKGMHILLDGVFEDTGSDSVYFNKYGNYPSTGAWQTYQDASKSSPYYNWYSWTNDPKNPYNSWWGYDTLPLTNTDNASYQNFIYNSDNSVAKYWIKNGASGWRLDSADNSNFNPTWWGAFRQAVKQIDPDAAIVGEIWNNATNDNGIDWLTGSTFDSVMNYQFRDAVIDFFRGNYDDGNEVHQAVDAAGFNAQLMRLYSEYPKPAFYAMMNLIDSQDTMRILTVLENAPSPSDTSALDQATYQPTSANQTTGIAKLKLVSDLQFAFPGAPTIWYGDEAGQTGYKDPLSRKTYPWDHQNEDLLNHYRQLGAIRTANPVLQTGDFAPLYTSGNVYAFARTITGGKDVFGKSEKDASAVVVLNNNANTQSVTIPVQSGIADGTKFLDELTGSWYAVKNQSITMSLAAYQGAILIANPTAPIAFMKKSGSSIMMTWTPVNGATGYRLWIKDKNGQWHPKESPMSSDARSADVTKLMGSLTVHARIEALFGRGADQEQSHTVDEVTSNPVTLVK